MLRYSQSMANRPGFTCAFCAACSLRRLPIRQLHSSNKTNEYGTSQEPRTNNGTSFTPPSGFQSLRKRGPPVDVASKWNLHGPGASDGNRPLGSQNNSNNGEGNQPPVSSWLARPIKPFSGRDKTWTGPAILRPGDQPKLQPREPLRIDQAPRFGDRGRDVGSNDQRPRMEQRFGRNEKFSRGGRWGRDEPQAARKEEPRNNVFSRDEPPSGRLGVFQPFTRNGAPAGNREDRWDDRRSSRFARREDDVRPTPSRFTTNEPIRTRERMVDSGFSKRRAAKEKERNRNRRFDDSKSAILDEEAGMTAKELRKAKKAKKKGKPKELIPILLPQFISVENLASMLNIRVEKFTNQLKEMGFSETSHSHVLGAEEAGLIAGEYGYEPVIDRGEEIDLKPRPRPEDTSQLPTRPPVVTIMGHVDHGKTTLLDWLRKSSVAASEHGGITQHIGAFSVTMPSGRIITFLDTPGHEAFLSMRERGANVTDIVILVIAADDSVKPQTIEAIKHAKAANVPIIVAINKIDKDNASVEKVQGDLSRYGVDVEDSGGDTQTVCVSGKTGQGMGELEEATVTLSEILDHRAELDGQVEGWVLEATTKKKGRVATVLVSRGTLRPGDIVVAGMTWTKVRTLTNERGEDVPFASPGTPVEVDGWKDQPEAGELALSAETEDRAKGAVSYRMEKAERIKQTVDMEAINESRRLVREKEEREEAIRQAATERGVDPEEAVAEAAKNVRDSMPAKMQEVRLIVKGDVAGSVEAVVDYISGLGNEEVMTKVIRSSFGAVSEFDVDHAAAAGAYIISFNLPAEPQIHQYARARNVTIISQNVIYRLVDEVKSKLSDLLPPKITTTVIGDADIVQVFQINIRGKKYKPVAGCRVKNGAITRNSKIRVIRNKEVIFDGNLDSLKNVKKDVIEMKKGSDCGMGFEGWGGFQEGDQVQCYEVIEEKRYLS